MNCIILYWSDKSVYDDYLYWMYRDAFENRTAVLSTPPLKISRLLFDHNQQIKAGNVLWTSIAHYFWKKGLNNTDENVLFIKEWHPILYDVKFIESLRKKYKLKIVLTLHNRVKNKRNPFVGVDHKLEDMRKICDLITTDEPEDSSLYGFPYFPDPMSNMFENAKFPIDQDVCFCGADKGRFDTIKMISKLASKNNVKTDFIIVNNAKYHVKGITFSGMNKYTEIIKQDLRSNCILEVLQPGQNGYSLRMEEAVILGKKLLTNNPLVKTSQFYNPKYIQYFDNPKDIDWNFVKERIPIDYHYHNEYSGTNFIKEVLNILERKV